ncbi:hypothetical protein L1887_24440 [Cichorium endivia]|nr:hypothetical protein L1887_24440 [Cichorium endivia]
MVFRKLELVLPSMEASKTVHHAKWQSCPTNSSIKLKRAKSIIESYSSCPTNSLRHASFVQASMSSTPISETIPVILEKGFDVVNATFSVVHGVVDETEAKSDVF